MPRVWLTVLAGSHFGNYQAGLRFANLGYDLVEKRGWHRYQARIYLSVGHLVMPWTQHVKTGRELNASIASVRSRTANGEFHEGVIDLASFDGSRWTVIDYKTGPGDEPRYRRQIAIYGEIIRKTTAAPVRLVVLEIT